ncbi:hypothetical protein Nepgr_002490 [Nepenthes gracilis]|uniref:Uncharacterized protein n=1 Tax=Nepenthes gracilis TaxID=150966 RepID=A0AAD3RYB0_NEPGR|nr:hypothetical protein Nepgr_002490 [Nepenthes gracilis]
MYPGIVGPKSRERLTWAWAIDGEVGLRCRTVVDRKRGIVGDRAAEIRLKCISANENGISFACFGQTKTKSLISWPMRGGAEMDVGVESVAKNREMATEMTDSCNWMPRWYYQGAR